MPIGAVPPASVSGVTVEIAPPEEETATIEKIEETGAFSIPAGQRYVKIYNAGITQDGDIEADATVNWASSTEDLSVGDQWYFKTEPQTDKVFLSPAITGNGNGSRVFIEYWG